MAVISAARTAVATEPLRSVEIERGHAPAPPPSAERNSEPQAPAAALGGAGRGCGQGARLPAPAGCQNQLLCWLRASGVAIQGAPDYEPSVSPCDNYTSAYRRMANVGARLLMLMALMMVITSHSGDGLLR